MNGQTSPGQQAPQLVNARELADRVEAPVQYPVPTLQVGQQPPEGLSRRPGLWWEILRLGLFQLLPESFQPGRVLPDEQLHGEVQGVEGPGEGSQLGLVDLQAHHLANSNLHSVQPHRPVLLQV